MRCAISAGCASVVREISLWITMSRPSGTHLQSKGFSFIRIIIMMDDLIILLFDALMPKDLKLRNKTLSICVTEFEVFSSRIFFSFCSKTPTHVKRACWISEIEQLLGKHKIGWEYTPGPFPLYFSKYKSLVPVKISYCRTNRFLLYSSNVYLLIT